MPVLGDTPQARRLERVALVAPSIKVLYIPTAKAACSTMRLIVAQAAGTHRPDLADRVTSHLLSPAQTIHSASVHGLRGLSQFPARTIREILQSPEWLRVTSIRHPLGRAYSAWGNRLLLRAPGLARRFADVAADVLVEDADHPGRAGEHRAERLDLTATFANFVRTFAEHHRELMGDGHFMTQTDFSRPDLVDYSMRVRVDAPGELAGFARMLCERRTAMGLPTIDIVPQRLNEGLGVPLHKVCTREQAEIIESIYRVDFDTFGFESYDAAPLATELAPHVLSVGETRLLMQLRDVIQRSLDIRDATRLRSGWGFRLPRAIYAAAHRLSRGYVAIPQRYV
jgi:hypothetical protein